MDLNEALKILADADRRHIVYALVENDGLSTVSDLARRIASRADDDSDTALRHAKISLVHNHLPRLEDHGVLEYDTRSGDVVLTDAASVEPLLDASETVENAVAETAKSA